MPQYIRHDEGTFASLTKQQKEAVWLLSIGTFLEYFDLMLYVHMAVLLNELFFPKTHNLHDTSFFSAFAFCSVYALRPIGSLIFGWIGDNIGRKSIVIITTFMMAVSCFTMATLPTYSQIGISAAYTVTILRFIQGMSSMGEVAGAELYLTEFIKPPVQYPIVTLMISAAAFGGMMSLAIASLIIYFELNWRIAFWFGACIAIIGTSARIKLHETPEFTNAKIRIKNAIEKCKQNPSKIINLFEESVSWKTSISYFFIQCARPVYFYFAYFYCGDILKSSFHYTPKQIIYHNFLLSAVDFLGIVCLSILSYKLYPLRILKIKLVIYCIFTLFTPYLLNNVNTPLDLLIIQSFIVIFAVDNSPATAIFLKHFPVFKRFTYSTFTYALSRAVIYAVTAFGLMYFTTKFGNWGIIIIIIPSIIGFGFALYHFIKLEKIRNFK